MSSDVVDFADRRDDGEIQALEATCANPRCDEQFRRAVGPGRPKDFHSEDCRRSAEREHRRLAGLLGHYERQAEQIRARIGAYLRTSGEEALGVCPSASELTRAREAIAEVRGMARFLPQHQGEFAPELLELFEAVEPLLRSPAT
jgi:hypothetical protein